MFILKKFSKRKKIICLLFSILFVIMLSIGIPSLARYRNRVSISIEQWDGSIANSYKSGDGTLENPYIISNGPELAFFSESLTDDNNYEGKYFKLVNNIVLNSGNFNKSEDNFTYTLENNSYYIKDGNYYSDTTYNDLVGKLNVLNSFDKFKGYFDGDSYTIYGLYMNGDEVGLFTNLEGNVSDLYVENALLLGDSIAGGIATNTNNSKIENVLFDGYVINKGITVTDNILFSIDAIAVSNIENSLDIELPIDIPFGSTNISVKLIGDYNIDDLSNSTIKINDNLLADNHFELVLNDLNHLTISTIADIDTILTFSDVFLEISYEYGYSGGIAASANNSEFKNVINKGKIYSNSIAGGITGKISNSSIVNSYNTGLIDALYDGGIISVGSGNLTLDKTYNTNENTGLISTINNSTVSISNSFNTSAINVINEVNNSELTISDSYVLDSAYDITNKFLTTEIANLKNKEFLKNIYKEFVSFENLETDKENIWIYGNDKFPVLYIDDINNPVSKLHVNIYTYNNFSPEIDVMKFTNNITFSIEDIELNTTTKYYYISNSKIPLTENQLEEVEWIPYNEIVQIEEEGIYVIYVKSVDNNENVFYLNSDLLILDLSGSTASINLNNYTWNTSNNNLKHIYINNNSNITIEAIDELSGIKSIEYYVSNELVDLEDINWVNYQESIFINEHGKYIVYAKIVDNCDYITYVNTDYIIYDGYIKTMSYGRNGNNVTKLNITDKSIVKFNFEYDGNDLIEGSHKIISNVILPVGTMISLYDYNKEKFYEYQITTDDDFGYNDNCNESECYATYEFNLFKEKGNLNEILYVEDNNISSERFDVILDFKNANISQNLNNLQLKIEKVNQDTVISTLENESNYNIYINSDSTPYLTTTYNDEIIYNSDSEYEINIVSGINYNYINSEIILDTLNEDKKQGLILKLVDSNGNILDNNYLKNLIFSIDDKEYYPGDDSIVRIHLSDSLDEISKNLIVKTHTNSAILNEGVYYIKIQNFVSYDGLHSNNYYNNITIPVVVKNGNHVLNNYKFDITSDDDYSIIYKENGDIDINFKIMKDGDFVNPNIRLSLYKKDQLTAYNQDYSIIDLKDFTTTELENYNTNIYYIPIDSENFNLNFIVNNFENNGYRLIFELYDDNKKIGSIIKNFIVR